MKLSKTQKVIFSQMSEAPQKALCDSGCYGYAGERAKKLGWEGLVKDPVQLEARAYTPKDGEPTTLELSGSVSLAAFLENNLVYCPELQRAFTRWCKQHPDEYELAWMEGFAFEQTKLARVVNSYNEDCDLTGTIQFVEFDWQDEKHVLLQVHTGADVRGSYSVPRAYKLRDYVEGLYDWNISNYWAGEMSWDEDGSNYEGRKLPNLFDGYKVAAFEWEGTLAKDLENLKQTDHDNEETRSTMTAEAERQRKEAYDALTDEVDIVVMNHKAYFKGELIQGDCNGLSG